MSNLWIKARKKIIAGKDIRVVRMMSALEADRFRTVGGLMSIWDWADDNVGDDGIAEGMTFELLDSVAAWSGFSAAMPKDWLDFDENVGVIFPGYMSHNGSTARKRALDAKRKSVSRKSPQSVQKKSGAKAPLSPSLSKSKSLSKTKLNECPGDLSAHSEMITRWFIYKQERNEAYKPTGLLSLWARMRKMGADLTDALEIAMANGWKGFDHGTRSNAGSSKPTPQRAAQQGCGLDQDALKRQKVKEREMLDA